MIKPYYEEPGITIYHADCRDILPHLEPVDLVLTDPPYDIGMKAFRDTLCASIEGLELVKANKMISFMSPAKVIDFANGLKSWKFHRLLWWNKIADIGYPWRGWYMNSEAILVFSREKAKWPKGVYFHSDLYRHGPELRKPLHPAWKPVSILKDLIQHGTETTILDPFCGSGPTLQAAKDLGRKAIGIEIEEKYCEIAVKRLSQEVLLL